MHATHFGDPMYLLIYLLFSKELIHFCDPIFENKNKGEKVKSFPFGKVKEIGGKEVKCLEYFDGFTLFFW
jgi:hypothetical protein